MKLHIRSVPDCTREELRTLLIDAAEQLAGPNCHLLEPRLPWDGYPILLADTRGRPVLVSFDCVNGQAALLNGLQAVEQLAVALPWVNQVYADLQQRQAPPRLVVVSPEPPPGGSAALAGCPRLTLLTCRVLRINDDTGVWLEPVGAQQETAGGIVEVGNDSPPRPLADPDAPPETVGQQQEQVVALSEEERAYFRQL